MNIGDLFLALRGDGTMLQQDVTKAGQKAGQTFGQQFGLTIGRGLRTAVGAGVGFAVGAALSGANELDAATRQLQADTGMTADEAAKAQHAIAGLYQNNIQGFSDISRALSVVTTDLGLTGDAATETTDAFLKFATATGQDAAEAASQFDDILDSWGLTAADAQEVMDKLIVSHQEYGGTIADNEKTLAALAPAMQAANLQIDDGIALLNLFGAKGIDANTASAAFAKSLTKVKSPEELQALITDISNTEDPFLRAEKAAKLFGARAGAKLANALQGANLDDYKVDMSEAAGATEKAADAVESGWGHKFTLLMHQAGGALAEFGQKFGPVLMVASAFGPQLTRVVGGALGGAIGLLAPVLKTVGTQMGVKIAAALGIELAASKTVATAIEGMPSGPVGAAAKLSGTKLGALMSGGIVGGIIAAGAAGMYEAQKQNLSVIETKMSEDFERFTKDLSDQQLKDLQKNLSEAVASPLGQLQTGLSGVFGQKGIQQELDQVNAAVAARAASTTSSVTGMVDHVVGDLKDDRIGDAADDAGQDIEDGIGDSADFTALKVETAAGKILSAIQGLRGEVGGAAQSAADAIFDPFLKGQELAQTKRDIAEQTRIIKDKDSTKKQIREATIRRTELSKQLFVQLTDLTTYGTDAQRISAIQAALASKSVADAYANGTPEQRAAIDEWKRVLTAQMTDLQKGAATGGAATTTAYAGGITSATPKVTTAAKGVANAVKNPLSGSIGAAETFGKNTAQAFADGIRAKVIATRNAAIAVSKAAQTIWRADSPPGPASPLHHIDTWGANTVSAWVDGLLSQSKNVRRAAQTISGVAAPSLSGAVSGTSLAMRASPSIPGALGASSVAHGGDTYNIQTHVDGLVRARDPLEVSGQLRRLADLGVLSPKKPAYR
jgi:hypothetical protein